MIQSTFPKRLSFYWNTNLSTSAPPNTLLSNYSFPNHAPIKFLVSQLWTTALSSIFPFHIIYRSTQVLRVLPSRLSLSETSMSISTYSFSFLFTASLITLSYGLNTNLIFHLNFSFTIKRPIIFLKDSCFKLSFYY